MPLKAGKYLKCLNCGKEIYVPKNRLNTFKYCSRRCLAIASMKKETAICPICGKEFNFISSRANKAKYCSRACYYKAQHLKGTVVEYCKNCGKEIKTSPSHKRIFCCRSCRSEYEMQKLKKSFTAIKGYFKKIGLISHCDECGYCEHPEILGIHHKDGNHKNNSYSNLQVLCPICHSLKHKKHIVHGGIRNAFEKGKR